MARPLTELATKYTHPTGAAHKIVAHTGKSGLTPVYIPPSILPTLSRRHRRYIQLLEHYQRFRCSKFSVQQLVELEAFAPSYTSQTADGGEDGGIDLANLQSIPIHPLFSKCRWKGTQFKHVGKIPLGKGRVGYFEPHNPLVWEALEPCLRLASGFMSNASILTWWDALLNGDYEYIEEDIPDDWKGGQLMRFRPSSGPPSTEEQIQKQLEEIAKEITYTLFSGSTHRYSALPLEVDDMFNFGISGQDITGDIHVSLAFEMLEPLMRRDINLTLAEKRLDHFRVAVTLLHETAHAIWYVIYKRHAGKDVCAEPFLEGQPMSELGFSMEEIVFGGRSVSITDPYIPSLHVGRGFPCASISSVSYFSKRQWETAAPEEPLIRPLPADWKHIETFPIPIGYFEDLYRPEFWDHVRQFGLKATRMGPKTVGRRTRRRLDGRPLLSWSPNIDAPPHGDIAMHNRMTPEEEAAAKLENLRRARARRILDAIGGEQDGMTGLDLDAIDAMDMDEFEPAVEETDPNHYLNQGRFFESMSAIFTESSHSELPSCPRYEEIRYYVLVNRGQDRLCLDTMNFDMPVFNLLQYICDLGGLTINSDEWIAFLKNCDDRGECFSYCDRGRGVVRWQEPSPLSLVASTSAPVPAPATNAWFSDVCLGHEWFYIAYADFEFSYLLRVLRTVDRRGGLWLNAQVLRELIDWHDKYGDLWRWGPKGIVRKRVDTWPPFDEDYSTSSCSCLADS